MSTAYEMFMKSFQDNPEAFREKQKELDAFAFSRVVMSLQRLQHHLSGYIMVDWFGEQLGNHLWEKFVIQHNRNLLSWLSKITSEYRYFVLHHLMTDARFK